MKWSKYQFCWLFDQKLAREHIHLSKLVSFHITKDKIGPTCMLYVVCNKTPVERNKNLWGWVGMFEVKIDGFIKVNQCDIWGQWNFHYFDLLDKSWSSSSNILPFCQILTNLERMLHICDNISNSIQSQVQFFISTDAFYC